MGGILQSALHLRLRRRLKSARILKLNTEMSNGTVDLSRFYAAPRARLICLPFKATGLFQPSAEWRQRGL